MAIGYPVDQSGINARAGALAVRANQLALVTTTWAADVAAIGNAGLVTLGFASGDATAMLTAGAQMILLADVYAAQASTIFNFDAALAPLRGLDATG